MLDHLWDAAVLTVVVSFLFAFAFALSQFWRWKDNHRCPLVHMTTETGATSIRASQEFVTRSSAVWAIRESIFKWCEHEWELVLATGLYFSRLDKPIYVPWSVRHLFQLVVPVGPLTCWKCVWGNYYAHFQIVSFATRTATDSTALRFHAGLYLTDIGLSFLIGTIAFIGIYLNL
jgi:hypothetical protein